MLFLAIHVHTPELCPSDNPELVKKTVSVLATKAHADKSGIKVLGSYIAPEEHMLFFIIESSDYTKIVDFFRPIMKMGTLKLTPVSTLESAVPRFE